MPAIEIHPNKKTISIRFNGSKVVLPKMLRQKVDQHWQRLVKANSRLHNGEVFTIVTARETDEKLDIELAETDYAHYLYSHQVGGLGTFTVRIIHSAALVITADNKIVFGAMNEDTSRPGIIQCCGGGIDHNDITDGIVDIEHNTVSELAEELGLNVYDQNVVEAFLPAYLKTGGATGRISLVYTVRLKWSGSQFLQHYEQFVENLRHAHQEPEFGQIFCIDMTRQSIEDFMKEREDKLDEYMPALLRICHNDSSR